MWPRPLSRWLHPARRRARKRADPPLKVLLLPEEQLFLRELRVPRRIGPTASLPCDPRDLPIDSLEVVFESLKLVGGGRLWRGQPRLGIDPLQEETQEYY